MVVVLTGKNSYKLQEYLHEIIADFTKNYGDSIERFDATELNNSDGIVDAVRSVSFLEPRKLVVVRNFGQNKELLEKINSIIEQTADSTDLVLVDEKLDKRTTMFKYLQKNCDLKLFNEMSPYDLEKWLLEKAKSMKVTIKKPEASFLIERVGPNQQLLFQELLKLSNYSTTITKDSILELVEPTPQSKVFDMLDALFSGNAKKAHELYADQRSQGEEPQKLLAMITWQLQQLTLALFAPEKTVSVLTSNGMSPYSAQKALQLGSKITQKDLKFFINELAEIDLQSKTTADIESAIVVYFSEVSNRINSKN